MDRIFLNNDWDVLLAEEWNKPYFKELCRFLSIERSSNKVFPAELLVFEAFRLCSFENLKIVLLGQDPYHKEGQAHGLSFSVPAGIKLPPSLRNIFTELKNEYSFETPKNGDLSQWSKQGVLLLNTTLTVRESQPGSHSSRGWEKFTDHVIKMISDKKEHVVFMFWGNHAKNKIDLIDTRKHCILLSPHPSPLSSYRGFFGNNHFILANEFLKRKSIPEVDWTKL